MTEEIGRLRQQLQNMGTEHNIADDEMTRLLIMDVALTHREPIPKI